MLGSSVPLGSVRAHALPPRSRANTRGLRWGAAGILLLMVLAVSAVTAARGGSISVRVYDARSGAPLNGAFVQVGPAPGDPFTGNWGWTGPDGRITFTHAQITGPQTVTAGLESYALLSVMHSVVDSIGLGLQRAVQETTLPAPKAQISGTVTGITTQSNDGNLDVGMVYPAVRLADLLSTRTLPFEVPADTVNFPLIGATVLPGNVVVPSQIEGYIFNFSKPNYHVFVPDGQSYDFLVVAGRIPLTALGGTDIPFNAITMREVGAERNIPVSGDRTVNLNSDLNLAHTLTVTVPEAINGSDVFVTSVAEIPGGSPRDLFYDVKSALRDTLTAFHMSGLNPVGDLLDATPFLAGYYGDSSGANAWQAGRVDRTPLTLPATRTLGAFFQVPDLDQQGSEYRWTDVTRPGVTPDPTWATSQFRLEAVNGDTAVAPYTAWEVWSPAGDHAVQVPILAQGAPGGLPDPAQSPGQDRLVWDCWLADPSGSIGQVLQNPFSTLTRWSRRAIEVTPQLTGVEEVALGTAAGSPLRFRLAPNPGHAEDILWDRPPIAGELVAWSISDPTGRRISSGRFRAADGVLQAGVLRGKTALPTGVYWVRLEAGGRVGTAPLVVIR